MYKNIDEFFDKISKSKFRSRFNLTYKDIEYIDKKGLITIEKHAYELITKRLAPKIIPNDGKQTPMKGHPVFITQHKTATCCRTCLYKWHGINKNKELSQAEINYIVKIIMYSIKDEYMKEKTDLIIGKQM